MKALSLTQPWASLVAIGAKSIETRSWNTTHRGWLAIHASKVMPRSAYDLCFDEPFFSSLLPAGDWVPNADQPAPAKLNLPFGAIVAVVNLHKVGQIGRHPESGAVTVRGLELPISYNLPPCPHELAYGDFTPGRFGWVMTGVRRLSTPIPCRGALGLWEVPPDVEAEIRKQVKL